MKLFVKNQWNRTILPIRRSLSQLCGEIKTGFVAITNLLAVAFCCICLLTNGKWNDIFFGVGLQVGIFNEYTNRIECFLCKIRCVHRVPASFWSVFVVVESIRKTMPIDVHRPYDVPTTRSELISDVIHQACIITLILINLILLQGDSHRIGKEQKNVVMCGRYLISSIDITSKSPIVYILKMEIMHLLEYNI